MTTEADLIRLYRELLSQSWVGRYEALNAMWKRIIAAALHPETETKP